MKKEINILHISPYFNYVCGVSKYVYLVLKGLKNIPVQNIKLNLYFITNGGDGLERFNSIGIKPVLIDFKKGLVNLLYVKNNVELLYDFCLSKNIDIIHTHHRYPEWLSCIVKKRINKVSFKKIKTVSTVHSIVRGYKKLSFKSDKIIAVSNTVKNHLVENYKIKEGKIIQLYNPIDKADIEINDKIEKNYFNFDKKSKILLYVGRFCKEKGVDILINAFNGLTKIENLFLLMLTDINEKDKIKIKKCNPKIIFISPQSDIKKYYQIADIIVLPSLVESFSYVILETALNRKLLVVSNAAGNREFIKNDVHAIMFESGSYSSLLLAIKKALNIAEIKKQQLIENLYMQVSTINTVQQYSEKLLTLYQDLLKVN